MMLDKNNELRNANCIAVFGTSGSGKSYVSNIILKSKNKKVMYIDTDFQNNLTGIFYKKDRCNDLSNIKTFSELKQITKENKRIYHLYFSNIYTYKEDHIQKVNYIVNKNKQYMKVLDMSSYIHMKGTMKFMTISDIIIFVVNPNFISIRQAVKYLDYLVYNYKIRRNKIKLIINRVTKYSLDKAYINDVFREYEIIGYIKYEKLLEKKINLQKIEQVEI